MNSFRFSAITSIFLLFYISCFGQQVDHPGKVQDDLSLVQAVQSQQNQFYVEAGNLTVTKILPDDTQGLPHEKWQARLSNGQTVTVVYNLNMGNRIPLKVGDRFGVGGMFIWTQNGGLIHWLHNDPRKQRPDGYVYLDGKVYGLSEN